MTAASYLLSLAPAIATILLALIGTAITVLQYRLNHDKLRLELFDRRLDVYRDVELFFASVHYEGQVKIEALRPLHKAREMSRFLFGSEVEKALREITRLAEDARTYHTLLYDGMGGGLPVGVERSKVAKAEGEIRKQLLGPCRTQFDALMPKYLWFGRTSDDQWLSAMSPRDRQNTKQSEWIV